MYVRTRAVCSEIQYIAYPIAVCILTNNANRNTPPFFIGRLTTLQFNNPAHSILTRERDHKLPCQHTYVTCLKYILTTYMCAFKKNT